MQLHKAVIGPKAFSSDLGTGSREENASANKSRRTSMVKRTSFEGDGCP
jgi:hypothetical protein